MTSRASYGLIHVQHAQLVKIFYPIFLLLSLLCHAAEPIESGPNQPVVTPPVAITGSERLVPTTMSESQQFRIAGSETAVRAALSFIAEQTKRDMQQILQEKDGWKVPISIILVGKPGDPIKPQSIVFDFTYDDSKGFDLLIYIHLAQGFNEEKFRSAIIKALLHERYLRGKKTAGFKDELLIRPWLTEGIAEAIDWKSGKRDRRLYQLLFQANELYSFDELLSTSQSKFDSLDGAMTSAFQASAGSLVMALIEQPEGNVAFSQFLSEAAGFHGEISVLLTKHFPKLNLSNKSLEKWWSLKMANLGRSSLGEVLSVAESESALVDALHLNFPPEEGKNQIRKIDDWENFLTLDDELRVAGTRHAQQKIVRLSYRCFPSYRQILQEYQSILNALVTKKSTKNIASKLADLVKQREVMQQKFQRASDFLDWYEITRARQTTGAFDQYLKTKERINQGVQRKSDHISTYLDRAQQLYDRKLPNSKK